MRLTKEEKAKKKWQKEIEYFGRECALDTIEGFYRAIGNKDLYENFCSRFNSCSNKTSEMNILVKDVFKSANLEYVFDAADKNSLKYFRLMFREFFGRGHVNDEARDVIDRGLLIKMAYKQNFICPICQKPLDLDLKNGPLKVVADHWSARTKTGDKIEVLQHLYGKDAIGVVAVHQHCNSVKGTKYYLFSRIEQLKNPVLN